MHFNSIIHNLCCCSLANLGKVGFMHRLRHQSRHDASATMVHGLASTIPTMLVHRLVHGLATTIMMGGLPTVIGMKVGLATTIMMGGLATRMIGVEARLATTIMLEVGLPTVIGVGARLATTIMMVEVGLPTMIGVEAMLAAMVMGAKNVRWRQLIHRSQGTTEGISAQK